MLNTILILEITFYYFFLMGLMIYMFQIRKKAIIDKKISPKYFKAYTDETPDDLKILENHYNNHFQIPIFYVLAAILGLTLGTTSIITIVLSSLFVISRIAHSFIHLGSNKLLLRAGVFFGGVLLVGLMFLEVLIKSI